MTPSNQTPNLPPDPGGHFDSDPHRRVQAAVPNPDDPGMSVEELFERRIRRDTELNGQNVKGFVLYEDVLDEILADLEADGHSEKTEDGWKNTKEGFNLLTGPPAGAHIE